MLKLSEKNWSEFFIKDLFITETYKNKLQMPTGAYINKKDLQEGLIPRITVTSQNNGIDSFCISKNKNFRTFTNFISVSFLGTIFYHPYTASIDMKVHCLQLKDRSLNQYLSLFLISEIKKSIENASYGNQLSSTDLPNKKIMLPVDSEGVPDYIYMEKYTEKVVAEKRQKYLNYCTNSIILGGGVQLSVDCTNNTIWKEFFVRDIFPIVQRGKRLIKDNQVLGDIPYISSSALNNGVDNFIGNDKGVRKFSDCLSLANSGSVGSCFYEPFEFVASDHITHLKNIDLTPYQYLFIATVLNRLSEKYNFNREINDKRISREKVLLPIDKNGNPDYAFMEDYVKRIIAKKYNSYISYCNKQMDKI